MATVLIERLPRQEYLEGCVALPGEYGSAEWERRPEVQAIRRAVFAALDGLEERTDIGKRLRGRHVLVKPNLVLVYYHMGTLQPVSPETTDPRVLDAVVLWLSGRVGRITICESSGRGSPTRSSFAVSGIDRLARHRGCGLIALEEQPVDRYILPKAKVQREIAVPRIFSEVVRGEAAYVSVPKLKTNLYTEVTLGFKNAMGVIPYNLRQRNHNYAIERKLVEILYLFSPDITLIDGVVGGEGECPAPVDPVDSRLIIAGDHAVETDRVATRIMGFDPASVELIRIADELGFGASSGRKESTGSGAQVEIIGNTTVVPFRPADASLTSDRVAEEFPSLTFLVGIDREGGAAAESGNPADTSEKVEKMQRVCRGGCIATIRFGLGMLKAEGIEITDPAVVIVGAGVDGPGPERKPKQESGRFWYDKEGKAYSREDIEELPGRKVIIGSCGAALANAADLYVPGCIPFPNSPHAVLHRLAGRSCRVMSLKNKQLFSLGKAMLKTRRIRRSQIKRGIALDLPLQLDDRIAPTRELSPEEEKNDWIEWPLPPLDREQVRRALAFEDDSTASSFIGTPVENIVGKIVWQIQAVLTFIVTLSPLIPAAVAALLGRPVGLSAQGWLTLFLAIELLHAAELPLALKTARERGMPRLLMAVKTLLMGYPAWLPFRKGIR